MKIAVGADHRGRDACNQLITWLGQQHELIQLGPSNSEVCDYPDVAYAVGMMVAAGRVDRGVLICGSGIGMSIAANKIHGVRAALVHDEIGATMSRQHNNANIICLPADMLGSRIIERIVKSWLTTEFEGGRHARRVAKIATIEAGDDPATLDKAKL